MSCWLRFSRQCHGFTLIEVMVVITIVGVMAGAVVLTFTHSVSAATSKDVMERIKDLDAATRHAARHGHTPLRIVIDLEKRILSQRDAAGNETGTSVRLPRTLRIDRVLNTAEKEQRFGQLGVDISGEGFSPTYAVFVVDESRSESGILFAGLTGQATTVNGQKAQDIIASIAPRDDAH